MAEFLIKQGWTIDRGNGRLFGKGREAELLKELEKEPRERQRLIDRGYLIPTKAKSEAKPSSTKKESAESKSEAGPGEVEKENTGSRKRTRDDKK